MQEVERKKFLDKNPNGRFNAKKFHAEMREHGLFVLSAALRIGAEYVLSHYQAHRDIGQVFDITKNQALLLPLHVEKGRNFPRAFDDDAYCDRFVATNSTRTQKFEFLA